MIWRPVLHGTLAEGALETVAAIGHALSDPRALEALDSDVDRPNRAAPADLAGGRAGLAVFFSYLARTQRGNHARVAADLLDASITVLESTTMSPSLYEGFTGVAWASAHLATRDEDDGDPHAEVDEALIQYLSQTPWTDDYDLVSGLVGIGVYALEQRPRPRADVILALVLDRLAELAQRIGGGVTWHTPPDLLHDDQRERCPAGHYNLGVAHRIPGVIALLGLSCQAGHDVSARPLLERAVAWVLDQRLGPDASSVFPTWIAPGRDTTPARLAWCYGDAGMAATLLVAARGARRSDWEREALGIAKRAADRPDDTTGIRDAGLCHGAAGLAHLFNRMYQTTGEEWLAEAGQRWFTRTLDMRRPGEGLAGFLAMRLDADQNEQWIPEPGLLTGVAGIGLALLAGSSSLEPAWDRALLLAIPDEAGWSR